MCHVRQVLYKNNQKLLTRHFQRVKRALSLTNSENTEVATKGNKEVFIAPARWCGRGLREAKSARLPSVCVRKWREEAGIL
jgi:hypothetical protein